MTDAMNDYSDVCAERDRLVKHVTQLAEHIIALQKTNGNLTDKVDKLQRVAKTAVEVEAWWARENIGDALHGAPVEIFNLRQALAPLKDDK